MKKCLFINKMHGLFLAGLLISKLAFAGYPINKQQKEKCYQGITRALEQGFCLGQGFDEWPEIFGRYKGQFEQAEDVETFILTLYRAVSEFGISHMSVYASVRWHKLFGPQTFSSNDTRHANCINFPNILDAGIVGQSQTEGFLITDISPGSAAAKSGLQMGDVLTFVRDISRNISTESVSNARQLSGYEGDVFEIHGLRKGGESFRTELKLCEQKEPRIEHFEYKQLRPEVSYIKIKDFSTSLSKSDEQDYEYPSSIVEKYFPLYSSYCESFYVLATFKQIERSKLLIIDLRGNRGGSPHYLNYITSLLVPNHHYSYFTVGKENIERCFRGLKKVCELKEENVQKLVATLQDESLIKDHDPYNWDISFLEETRRHHSMLKEAGQKLNYDLSGVKFVALIDGFTFSCGEVMADLLKVHKVVTIGTPTGGGVVSPFYHFILEDTISKDIEDESWENRLEIQLTVPHTDFLTEDGRRLEGRKNRVQPDIFMETRCSEIYENPLEDPWVKEAIKIGLEE